MVAVIKLKIRMIVVAVKIDIFYRTKFALSLQLTSILIKHPISYFNL